MTATLELCTPEQIDETIAAFESQFSAIPVAETDIEYESRLQASRFIGSVLCPDVVELPVTELEPVTRPIDSLFDALKSIEKDDNHEARQMVAINVRTDRIERQIKAGHVGRKITLLEDEQGRIQQFGQKMESVHANSLRTARPKMLARTKAEAYNAFRIQHCKDMDETLLRDNYFAVVSLVPNDMSHEELTEECFFTKTMSLTVQFNSIENGKLVIEPAFIAGKKNEKAPRNDFPTIVKVGQELGVDWSGMDATQIIDTPILIPKNLMPNGVIDFVKLYDDCQEGTFFGQESDQEIIAIDDYLKHRQHCAELEESMEPKVVEVTNDLILSSPYINSPVEACERLAKLNGESLVYEAVADRTIDADIFGSDAAWRVELSRHHFEQGNQQQAQVAAQQAVRLERSSSCPTGVRRAEEDSEQSTTDEKEEKLEDCEFESKKCPVCGDKPAQTKVKNGVFYHVGKSCKS